MSRYKIIATKLQALCDEFNALYPVGTPVNVMLDGHDEPKPTTTRSEAQVLSGHSAVIWLDDVSGCYLLDRVTPQPDAPVNSTTAEVGGLVKFVGERNPYRIRARSDRFLICTKPFAPKKTVIYCIVDFEKSTRGPDNMIFGRSYESDDDCAARLRELEAGEIAVSRQRVGALQIEYFKARRA